MKNSMTKTTLFACLSVAAGGLAQHAAASIILSNLPGVEANGSSLGSYPGFSSDATKAVGITTGASDLSFVSMQVMIYNVNASAQLGGGIYADASGRPQVGAPLAAFTTRSLSPIIPASLVTLTIPGGFTMLAGTTYWFRLTSGENLFEMQWQRLEPNTAPTAPTPGDPDAVTLAGYRFSEDGGATWSNSGVFNGVSIEADVIPAPGPSALLGLGGLLAARRRRVIA
jgi:hypothetical protein